MTIPKKPAFLFVHSTGLGALTGAVLAAFYGVLVLIALGGSILSANVTNGRLGDALIGNGVMLICGLPFLALLAVLPGALFGAVGGFFIALLLTLFHNQIPRAGALRVSVVLCVGLLLVLVLHLIFGFPAQWQANSPEPSISFVPPYWLWLGFPGIIGTLGAGWVGWKLGA